MGVLHVFNPEHDYALSLGEGIYIAKDAIKRLAESLQFLPSLWSASEDFILGCDNRIYNASDFKPIERNTDVIGEIESVAPWGWDYTIRERFLAIGIDENLMPSLEEIRQIRKLSHRHLTIPLNQYLGSPCIPVEFYEEKEALTFYHENPDCYFKAPWSSSGRGVISTWTMKPKLVEEWIHGTIKRQKSVLAEKSVNKKIDFASLWTCNNGKVGFRGVSVSKTSNRGKYTSNMCESQNKLLKYIRKHTFHFTKDLLEMQRHFIENEISPHYSGRLGIDMMITEDGKVIPGVEINLRNTMGHVAIDLFRSISEKSFGTKNDYFLKLFEFNRL